MGKISKRFVDGLVDLGNGLEYKDLPKTSHNGVTIFDPDIDMANNPSYVSTNIGSGVLVRKDYDRIKVSWSWAVSDYDFDTGTGTDNSTAIQACFDVAYEEGVPLIIDGKYGVGSSVYIRPITLLGHGVGVSVIGAVADDFTVLGNQDGYLSGTFSASDFSVFGFAKHNPTLADTNVRGIRCPNFDTFHAYNIEVGYVRQMGITSLSNTSIVDRCNVHHIHRDGINLTGSFHREVIGCKISNVRDDAIALHIPPSASTDIRSKYKSISKDNVLHNCRGIKVLSNGCEVTGNVGTMIFGYGVYVGLDNTYGEGFIDKVCANIDNNTFINVINPLSIGESTNLGAGIYIESVAEPLQDGTYPGEVNLSATGFNEELTSIEFLGQGVGKVGLLGCRITNNSVIQTWTGGANISDFNQDGAWTKTGFTDVPFTGTLHTNGNIVQGVRVDGVAKDMIISNNITYGVDIGLTFTNILKMINVDVSIGLIKRVNIAISVIKNASLDELSVYNTKFKNGIIDIDPYHENVDRNIDGTWINTGDFSGSVLRAHLVNGCALLGATISNAKKLIHGQTIPILLGNVCTRGLSGKGIGIVNNSTGQLHTIINADPTSAGYKEVMQGSLMESNAMPVAGTYCVGQEVYSSNPSVVDADFGVRVVKYVRLTDGDTHIANVDWGVVAI